MASTTARPVEKRASQRSRVVRATRGVANFVQKHPAKTTSVLLTIAMVTMAHVLNLELEPPTFMVDNVSSVTAYAHKNTLKAGRVLASYASSLLDIARAALRKPAGLVWDAASSVRGVVKRVSEYAPSPLGLYRAYKGLKRRVFGSGSLGLTQAFQEPAEASESS